MPVVQKPPGSGERSPQGCRDRYSGTSAWYCRKDTSRSGLARLKQEGVFRRGPGQDWVPIEAEQYFTTDRPSFLWHAMLRPGRFFWIEGRDRYDRGKGSMRIRLLSTITVADATGPEIDVSSLVRYLGEMPWFPGAFLHRGVVRLGANRRLPGTGDHQRRAALCTGDLCLR